MIKAALNGFASIVTLLMSRGADIEIANNAGMTAYDFAVKNDHKHIATKIKEKLTTLRSKTSLRQSGATLKQQSKAGLSAGGGSKVGKSFLSEKNLQAGQGSKMLNSGHSSLSVHDSGASAGVEHKSSVSKLHSESSTSSINGGSGDRVGGSRGAKGMPGIVRVDSSSSVVSQVLGKGGAKQKASTSALNRAFGQVHEDAEDLDKLLLYAILGENEAEAIDLILRGANVDVTFPDGCVMPYLYHSALYII